MTPQRIQRKRTRGWKMPPNTIYVGRPTKWGNRFTIKEYGLEKALEYYEASIKSNIKTGLIDISELKGKNLACFCRLDQPCHSDILLKLANE